MISNKNHQTIRYLFLILFIDIHLLISGCASVPEKAVKLSNLIGDDIEALPQSYKKYIHQYFDSLKDSIKESINKAFIPAYINDYVKTNKLIQNA